MTYYKCGRIHTTQNSNTIIDTASGSVANFETDLALPLKSLEIDVNAVQSGTGDPSPDNVRPISGWSSVNVTRCGKNLMNINAVAQYKYSSAEDLRYGILINKAGTYTINSFNESTCYILVKTVYADGTYSDVVRVQNGAVSTISAKTVTIASGNKLLVYNGGNNNEETAKGFLQNVQIELGSTATDYEPYNGNIEVINLGGTYYGGHFTQDKDGHRQFEVTHEIADLATYTKTINKVGSGDNTYFRFNVSPYPKEDGVVVCDKFKQVVINTSTNEVGISIVKPSTINHSVITFRPENPSDYSTTTILDYIQSLGSLVVVYELAEPYIIDLPDGEPIITIVGTNNIYADTGDTSLQFRKIG